MFGFRSSAEIDAVIVDLVEGLVECPQRGLVGLLDGVVSVYEDLGLDDRDEVVVLGERRVEGERLGVGLCSSWWGCRHLW